MFSAMAVAAAFAAAVVGSPPTPSDATASPGRLFVVQAVPSASYAVWIDGKEEPDQAAAGAVLGPFDLDSGKHEVRFEPSKGQPMTAAVEVRAGSSTDLVLHLPAEKGGDPIADVYRLSAKPAAPDTARVLVAHTATVPPADVKVDGKVVFEDIANGEFAVADVPAGKHSAALLPAGSTGDPILGPLDVELPAGTATMIYAVGTPTNGSMDVITHQESLAMDSSGQLRQISTGSAGLVRDRRVATFGR
jgi:hypothetical protein